MNGPAGILNAVAGVLGVLLWPVVVLLIVVIFCPSMVSIFVSLLMYLILICRCRLFHLVNSWCHVSSFT